MGITPAQIQAAQAVQHAAAHDAADLVRLIAGPGTGKSFSIEERVRWLLETGVAARQIAVISFTRASTIELRNRVHKHCIDNAQPQGVQVRISTLHSLALRMLRAAGLLQQYPAGPLVLDNAELEDVFDAEFGETQGLGKTRREDIRRDREAFWNTGQWDPPNYVPPVPPITDNERADFIAFHGPRTQTYACVLPGEMVRLCLAQMIAGNLDPAALIHLHQLIVDEYQDLNPIDQQFIDHLIAQGVTTFIAGDDDQSIYSFRYASPSGIQRFTEQHPATAQHALSDCFRCAPTIVAAATALITAHPGQNRIPKNLDSLYGAADPPIQGRVWRWRFGTALGEADAIAQSCAALIAAGVEARQILILLSNQRALLATLRNALTAAQVPFEAKSESFRDGDVARFAHALLRIVCDPDDYVARRLILGLRRGVGVGTCNQIAETVTGNGLNYRDVFYNQLPPDLFNVRCRTALAQARTVCADIALWQPPDTLGQRSAEITALLTAAFNAAGAADWNAFVAPLPLDMTLEEFRDWLWADTDDQLTSVLAAVHARLGQPVPVANVLPARVRVMTMHGAKGLSGKVVFIPGLEEEIFPGPKRQPYPGLVLEAARMLYASITRARAACIVSHATRRRIRERVVPVAPSRFAVNLNGAFMARANGLDAAEVQQMIDDIQQL